MTTVKNKYSLMKIISILMIIMLTLFTKLNIFNNTSNKVLDMALYLLECFIIVGYNSFILLLGYNHEDMNHHKLFHIINTSWFYRLIILLIVLLFRLTPLSRIQIINGLSIIDILDNWFIKLYLILYLLTPFINKLLSHLNHKEFKYLVILLFTIFSIIPFLTNNYIFKNDGYTLYSFIYLYILGYYLSKYNIKTNYLYLYIITPLLTFTLFQIGKIFVSKTSIIDDYVVGLISNLLSLSSPLVVLESIFYFMSFKDTKSSRLLDKISPLWLGIYVLINNTLINPLYNYLIKTHITSFTFILYLILITIIIFIITGLIEYLRLVLISYIKNTKRYQKTTKKYTKKLDHFIKLIN